MARNPDGTFPPRPENPAGGRGLHGPATGRPAAPFSAEHQAPREAKAGSKELRAMFRERLAAKLGKVEQVYDRALDDEDNRVGLVAAKQISVELWGQPEQPLTGADGGALSITVRQFFDPAPETEPEPGA